jgi:hypothetical protein
VEGLIKTAINLSEDIRSPGEYLNRGLPECEAGGAKQWAATFGDRRSTTSDTTVPTPTLRFRTNIPPYAAPSLAPP